ncbi:hypothetical protein ABPG72_001114, partial [Tetrahymena utriculariae]
ESYKHVFEEKNNEQHKNIEQINEESNKQQEDFYQQNQNSLKMNNRGKNNIKDVLIKMFSSNSKQQDTIEQLKHCDSKITYESDMQNT